MTYLATMTMETPVGPVELWASPSALVGAHFEGWTRPAGHYERRESRATPADRVAANAILKRAEAQLLEYFRGERSTFTVPLALPTAPFFRRVLEELCRVPPGETTTYGDLAKVVGRPTAARAVGMAMGRNPVALFVPCHRVVGKNGSLTGFAGGIPNKEWLLAHEKTLTGRAETSSAR